MKKTVQTNYVKYGELRQIKGVTTIIRADIAGKQDKLTTAQMAAVDSGITAAKVLSYDNAASLAHSHANKTSVLDKLRWDAQNNAIYIGDAEHPINFYAFGSITAGGVGSGGSGGQGGISTVYLGGTRYDAAEGSTAIYLPAYPTQVTWANISGKPSWIGSSKPSYAFGEIIGTAAAAQIPSLDASKITSGTFDAARIPNLSWNKISSDKPTTIAGYGITDGVTTATLAAWAGSVNITKVGTIATGVWNGTAIGDTYIASATNWNDAYDKRHTHSNKTVLDSITAQDLTDLRNLASWLGFDSTNNAVYVKKSATNVARNFYAFGAITAGGVGSGGGGGQGGISTIYLGSSRYDAAEGSTAIYLPAYPTQVTWANISGKPSWIGSSKPSYAFSELTSHPTTVSGYGITDIAQQAVAALTTSSLSKETDIVESGLRTYSGSGSSWTGSIGSMAYAGIITLGTPNRGIQLWARRGNGSTGSIHFRVGVDDGTAWNTVRIIIDSDNYTGYCATAAQGTNADYARAHLADYLPLSGGTITGTIQIGNAATIPFVRNFTALVSSGWERKIASIRVDGVDKFIIGAYGAYTLGASDNGVSYAYLGLNAYNGNNLRIYSDHLTFGANTIYHSGNLTKDTLGLGNVDNTADSVKIVARSNYADVLRDPSYYDFSHRRASANLNWADGGLHYYLATNSMTEGKPGGDGHILHMSWDNGSWEGQVNIPTAATNSPQWRTQNGGTWSDWMTFYHSANSNKADVAWACSTLTASGNITGALLKSTNNGNTVTIGSQNASFCHIYNSADVPFIFNKDIQTYGSLTPYGSGAHGLGNSSHRWGDAYVSGINASGNATIEGSLSMGDTLNMSENEVLLASSSVLYINRGLQTRTVDFFGTNIRFRNSGSVGIGTTSPSTKLHTVATSSGWTGLFSNGNNTVYLANGSGYGAWIGVSSTSSNNYILRALYGCTGVGSGGTTAMIILANGNVGINTGTPSQRLHVVGNIVATGAITAGAASDARLKDNIRNLTNALAVLKSLRPVSFDWNATATSNFSELKGHDVGLVAQEVEPYIPSAIGAIFGDYKRLDYTKVTPYLIAGWQDHESRIATLEKENSELKRRLNIN